VQLDELAREGQAEPGALVLPRLVAADLAELFEDPSWSSGAMPMPVSLTAIVTAPSVRVAWTRTAPPAGVNLIAFERRLRRICLTLRSSATGSPSRASSVRSRLTP
jgi:hypothetical protein